MEKIQNFVNQYKYIVISEDESCKLYKSLRNISSEILIDYTTISKKINSSITNDTYCQSKTTKLYFYIKKIN